MQKGVRLEQRLSKGSSRKVTETEGLITQTRPHIIAIPTPMPWFPQRDEKRSAAQSLASYKTIWAQVPIPTPICPNTQTLGHLYPHSHPDVEYNSLPSFFTLIRSHLGSTPWFAG